MLPHILIVDDQAPMRRAIARLIQLLDYKATYVESAEDALVVLDREYVDVVVTDIRMPGMSGIDLLRLLRQRDRLLPVMLITGTTDIHSAAEAVALGAFHHFTKPVDFGEFETSLAAAVAKRRRHTPAEPMPKALTPQLRQAIDHLRVKHQSLHNASGERLGYDALVGRKPATIPGHRIVDAASQLDLRPELAVRYCELALGPLRTTSDLVILDVDAANLVGDDAVIPASLLGQEQRLALQLPLDTAKSNLLPGRPIDKLRRAGARIILSTSTTGRSVIGEVTTLRPDFLRLSDDLVRRVLDSSGHQRLASPMVRMCVASGTQVIATGIRDSNEATVLGSLGCTCFQGTFFGRPVVLCGPAETKAHAS